MQLGAKVIACSDSSGYIYDKNGINLETIKYLKEENNLRIREYIKEHPHAEFNEDCSKIWSIPCDIALPCATQNEIDEKAARLLVANSVKAIGEGANMPCTKEAIVRFVENEVLFAPAKAANAGGVAVSAMEMSQNSMRLSWTAEEVDEKLQQIMKDIYKSCLNAARDVWPSRESNHWCKHCRLSKSCKRNGCSWRSIIIGLIIESRLPLTTSGSLFYFVIIMNSNVSLKVDFLNFLIKKVVIFFEYVIIKILSNA